MDYALNVYFIFGFTCLYNIALSVEFVSLRDNLFSEIMLEVLLDVSMSRVWLRVDISSLLPYENLVQGRHKMDSSFPLEWLATKRG